MFDAIILEKEYNVTMDKNFFSTNLADKLKGDKSILFGTISK